MRKVWRLAAVCISVLMLGDCGGQEETVKLTTDTFRSKSGNAA